MKFSHFKTLFLSLVLACILSQPCFAIGLTVLDKNFDPVIEDHYRFDPIKDSQLYWIISEPFFLTAVEKLHLNRVQLSEQDRAKSLVRASLTFEIESKSFYSNRIFESGESNFAIPLTPIAFEVKHLFYLKRSPGFRSQLRVL